MAMICVRHQFRIGFLHNPIELIVNINGDQNKNPVIETGKTLCSKMTDETVENIVLNEGVTC